MKETEGTMNTRTGLYVGLCLIGVYLLALALIGLPAVVGALSQPVPVEARMAALVASAMQWFAGLFLVVKAPSVSRMLAGRIDTESSRG